MCASGPTCFACAHQYQSPTCLLTRGGVGVGAERDTILWGKDEEEAWPEDRDPEQGFFVNTQAETEPYSALYVHLVVQIISGWVHVNKMMPSAKQMRNQAVVQDYCQKLVRMSYDGAYDRQQRMSVMLSFNDELWEDEEYHESQRQSNPHWRRKKEVYSYFQPGHVCAYCTSDCAICHTRNEECGVNCDGRYSCISRGIGLRRLVPSPCWYPWFRARSCRISGQW